MAQHDFIIDNQGFPAFRADLNDVLEAIASNSSGATGIPSPYNYQWWYDTTTDKLKMRNADNDAWIEVGDFDQATDTFSPANAVPATGGTFTGAVTVDHTITANRGVGLTETASKSGVPVPDMSEYQNFIWTLTGNITLSNPDDEVVGQSGFFVFIQDGTGGRTVSLGSQFLTAGGAGITLSATAGAIDVVPYIVQANAKILLGTPQLAFA